jgi:PKD repeat protein
MIAGQDIQFTDQSANNPTTWFWQFGDGTTSSLKNPRHAYAAPGTYTVTLRVTNEKGQSDLVKVNTSRSTPICRSRISTATRSWARLP